ncbi:hypothetical protein BDP27DRAFT_1457336 [Rhodocollybia butyracea]|uniref:Uncharacterized protein n=1 Tax=Rhodocollybia butyracea TaxID=206335 RepID=A0A9P5TWJ8_9AGAR|nr:hypothetical protein BDP27DRAFT_1457336 [Rhodocollybia butyracea]
MIFTSFLLLLFLINVDARPTDPHLEHRSDNPAPLLLGSTRLSYVYLPQDIVRHMQETENFLPVTVNRATSSLLEGTEIMDMAYPDPVAAMRALHPSDFGGYHECLISANKNSFINDNKHEMVFVNDQQALEHPEHYLKDFLRRSGIRDPDPIWFSKATNN